MFNVLLGNNSDSAIHEAHCRPEDTDGCDLASSVSRAGVATVDIEVGVPECDDGIQGVADGEPQQPGLDDEGRGSEDRVSCVRRTSTVYAGKGVERR